MRRGGETGTGKEEEYEHEKKVLMNKRGERNDKRKI